MHYPARPKGLATGAGRDSSRGDGEVIELECGIIVFALEGDPRDYNADAEALTLDVNVAPAA